MSLEPLRAQIDNSLADGNLAAVVADLERLWREHPSVRTAAVIVNRFEALRSRLALVEKRLTILRSYTVEPLLAPVRAAAFVAGIDLQITVGRFNTYAQEILDPDDPLLDASPELVVLAWQTRDVAPGLWDAGPDMDPAAIEQIVLATCATIARLVQAFRNRSDATLIVHTLDQPAWAAAGILDQQGPSSCQWALQRINQSLREVAATTPGVHVLDYDGVIARAGRRHWYDESKWLTSRMPLAAGAILPLVDEWMRFIEPLSGRQIKVLVADLDDTLWGGVLGEEGPAGLALGPEYPGAAFLALQRTLRDANLNGVLLAICSKNDLDEAIGVMAEHPAMLLRPEHFACLRINWRDKADNLREIAEELNIGLDAVAFLDGSPVERAQVRMALPQVTVIDLPDRLVDRPAVVRSHPRLQRLRVSAEDRARAGHYAAQRHVALDATGSVEDFYRSLDQRVEIAPLTAATLTRVAQLTHKTNQFNLTTKRYSEGQLQALAARPDVRVWTARVVDRFADNGLVGVAITIDTGAACEIDTLLLSCRVIGRRVESAILTWVMDDARARGCVRLAGRYVRTARNGPAQDFFARHAFVLEETSIEGELWHFDLTGSPEGPPA